MEVLDEGASALEVPVFAEREQLLAAAGTPTVTRSATVTSTLSLSSGSSTATADAGPSYVVQAGDTLVAIGERLGIPWQEIANLNGIAPAELRIGQRLRLPAPTATSTRTATASPAATPSATSTPSPTQTATRAGATPTVTERATVTLAATKAATAALTGTSVTPLLTPAPLAPALVLRSPGDGTPYSGDRAMIVLEWEPWDGMPPDAVYQVTVEWTEKGTPQKYSELRTTLTSLLFPPGLWSLADLPSRAYTWQVQAVRVGTDGQGGERVTPLSQPSAARVVYWQ